MKAKLIIGLILLISNIVEGQLVKMDFGANLIPSYYVHEYADLLDYSYFDGTKAKNFVLIRSLNVDYMIHKNIGVQIGFQQHNINLENKEYILENEFGFEFVLIKNYDYAVKVTSKQYEIPLHLILTKPINEKLNFSLLIGGARLKRSKVKYEFTNKENNEVEHSESDLKKDRVLSKFSPQLKIRMQYVIVNRLKISSLLFMKSRKLSSFDKVNLGLGLGLFYQLN